MDSSVSRRALLSALLAGAATGCIGTPEDDAGNEPSADSEPGTEADTGPSSDDTGSGDQTGDDPSTDAGGSGDQSGGTSSGDAGDSGGDSDGGDSDADDSDGGDSENGSNDDGSGDSGGSTEGVDEAAVERRIHELVNEERTSRGLSSLSWNGRVQNVADAHSADMILRDFFDHENPDGEGVGDRFEAHGVTDCQSWGENIAQTWWDRNVRTDDGVERYTTVDDLAEALVEGWMNSEGHRANVLGSDWTSQGIGVEVGSDDVVLATQNFCG